MAQIQRFSTILLIITTPSALVLYQIGDFMANTIEIMKRAKAISSSLSLLTESKKNEILALMADALESAATDILSANADDVERSRGVLSDVMIDRLILTKDRIKSMANGIRDVIKLPDPVGRIISSQTLPNGLKIEKVGVPLGVVAIVLVV